MRPCYARLTLLLTVLITACRPATERTEATADDYAVYSAYLNSFEFYRNVPRSDTIIIRDATSMRLTDIRSDAPWWRFANQDDTYPNDGDTTRYHKVRSKLWEPLFAEIKCQSYRSTCKLTNNFDTAYPVLVLSPAQFHQLYSYKDGVEHHAIFSLSKVVYDSSATKALFFSSFWCGGLCGWGELVMLEKVNRHWVMIETFRCWVS